MTSGSRQRKPLEATTLSEDPTISTRSAYGDNRAANEDAMMLAHAQILRANNTIDDEMATQLSQPWHKRGELKMKYTKGYLELHPDYTGKDAHEMPGLEWAKRKRKDKDRQMEKWLEDFRLGNIDENGNPIDDYNESSSSPLSGSGYEDEDEERDAQSRERHTGDTTLSVEEDDELWFGQPPNVETTQRSGVGQSEKNNASKHAGMTETILPKLEKYINGQYTTTKPPSPHTSGWLDLSSPPRSTSPALSPKLPVAKPKAPSKPSASSSSYSSALSSLPSSSSSNHISDPKAKPVRKRYHSIPSPPPLRPPPGSSTYQYLDYFALIALCRSRNLPGNGRAPFIRNRLIQDDTNIALGRAREVRKKKTAGRKRYKHAPPEGLGSGSSHGSGNGSRHASHMRGSSELSGGEGSQSGEDTIDTDTRNPVGRRIENRERVEALERKEESGGDSEDAFEVLTGPRVVKRKRGEDGEEVTGEAKKAKLMD